MIEALGAIHIVAQRPTGNTSVVGKDVALELLHADSVDPLTHYLVSSLPCWSLMLVHELPIKQLPMAICGGA
jgi:hypothetical protein